MEEIWKDIEGYDGIYQVSNIGRVKSKKLSSEKILKQNYSKIGYYKVDFSINGVKITKFVHQIIANAFIPNPENKPEVNHKNGIKTDNRVENLEWVTSSENRLHAFKIGLKKPNFAMKGILGYDNKLSKVVIQYDLIGKYVNEFGGTQEASRITKVKQPSISMCANGKVKSAGGYIWKYKQ